MSSCCSRHFLLHCLYNRVALYIYIRGDYGPLFPRPLDCLRFYSSKTTPVCCDDDQMVNQEVNVGYRWRTEPLPVAAKPAVTLTPETKALQSRVSCFAVPCSVSEMCPALAVSICWWAISITGIGELSSEVSRRMWLRMSYTEQGLCTLQRKRIPGILDPSIDGKALGAIELIVRHLVGIRGHSGITHN